MAKKYVSLEASITKLTFYHIRCFLLSKDAFTPNLAEFGPVTTARATNFVLNQSRIEILRVRKKLQNRQKLMTFWIVLNLWHPESSNFFWIFKIGQLLLFKQLTSNLCNSDKFKVSCLNSKNWPILKIQKNLNFQNNSKRY